MGSNPLPKSPLPNTFAMGIRFQHMNLEGWWDTTFILWQSIIILMHTINISISLYKSTFINVVVSGNCRDQNTKNFNLIDLTHYSTTLRTKGIATLDIFIEFYRIIYVP